MPRTEQDRRTLGLGPQCPDGAIRHGPPDGAGRCPWCRQKVAHAVPAPERYPRSDLSESYGRWYDPDEGALGAAELARRQAAGLTDY